MVEKVLGAREAGLERVVEVQVGVVVEMVEAVKAVVAVKVVVVKVVEVKVAAAMEGADLGADVGAEREEGDLGVGWGVVVVEKVVGVAHTRLVSTSAMMVLPAEQFVVL